MRYYQSFIIFIHIFYEQTGKYVNLCYNTCFGHFVSQNGRHLTLKCKVFIQSWDKKWHKCNCFVLLFVTNYEHHFSYVFISSSEHKVRYELWEHSPSGDGCVCMSVCLCMADCPFIFFCKRIFILNHRTNVNKQSRECSLGVLLSNVSKYFNSV